MRYAITQTDTDRHTDTLIAILCAHIEGGGEVKTSASYERKKEKTKQTKLDYLVKRMCSKITILPTLQN